LPEPIANRYFSRYAKRILSADQWQWGLQVMMPVVEFPRHVETMKIAFIGNFTAVTLCAPSNGGECGPPPGVVESSSMIE